MVRWENSSGRDWEGRKCVCREDVKTLKGREKLCIGWGSHQKLAELGIRGMRYKVEQEQVVVSGGFSETREGCK